jgi:hypothetical protein
MLVMLVLQSIYMNQIKEMLGCTRLAAANAKAYQLLAHGGCFSQGTPASCTSKKGCHDLAEILLKMALNSIIYL